MRMAEEKRKEEKKQKEAFDFSTPCSFTSPDLLPYLSCQGLFEKRYANVTVGARFDPLYLAVITPHIYHPTPCTHAHIHTHIRITGAHTQTHTVI